MTGTEVQHCIIQLLRQVRVQTAKPVRWGWLKAQCHIHFRGLISARDSDGKHDSTPQENPHTVDPLASGSGGHLSKHEAQDLFFSFLVSTERSQPEKVKGSDAEGK